MEAAPVTKKRKLDAPASQQQEETSSLAPDELLSPRPADAEAPESDRQNQGPPPVAGEGGTEYISRLPEAILGDIISLLPTNDGARTQILASSWRHLWRSAPLNLDFADLPADADVEALVSRILSGHVGSGRRLRIPAAHSTVDASLQSPALTNLQELEFCRVGNNICPLQPVPVFCFASRRRVPIIQCHLTAALRFPQLRRLALDDVHISESSLHGMIAGCPLLESMLLNGCTGFTYLRIRSTSLKNVGVSMASLPEKNILQKIIVKDAPRLVRLLQLDVSRKLDIQIISAPKLETLGCLSYFHLWPPYRCKAINFTTVVHSVKILSIFVYSLESGYGYRSHGMLSLLGEVVHPGNYSLFEPWTCVEKNLWRRKHRSAIKGLDIRLKTIVLTNYRGTRSHINFAMFFVLNATRLELMRFEGYCSKKFITRQHVLLQLCDKASRGARFDFTSDKCLGGLEDIKHAGDLSIADPFVRRC